MNCDPMQTDVILIKRKKPGVYVDGFLRPGEPNARFGRASVQPLTGREVDQLPEGDRGHERNWIYTATEIKRNDTIVWKEKNFEAENVEDYSQYLIPYYKVRAVRIDDKVPA